MASAALERVKAELSRAKSGARLARQNASGKGAPAMQAGSVLAGSALGAVIDEKIMPGGIAGQPASALVGGGLIVAGIFVLKGKTANMAILGGSGMLAPVVSDFVGEQLGGGSVELAAVGG
jgi:hypothetical protein